jgi:hypothetical protein
LPQHAVDVERCRRRQRRFAAQARQRKRDEARVGAEVRAVANAAEANRAAPYAACPDRIAQDQAASLLRKIRSPEGIEAHDAGARARVGDGEAADAHAVATEYAGFEKRPGLARVVCGVQEEVVVQKAAGTARRRFRHTHRHAFDHG